MTRIPWTHMVWPLSLGWISIGASAQEADPRLVFPHVLLSNQHLKALIYLPDAEKGFYRAQRFDWSGIVAQVTRGGTSYLGRLRPRHNPHGHDHAAGLVEEFDLHHPVGYSEARPGEPFVKIGVGLLQKTSTNRYAFSQEYPWVALPSWQVTCESDAVTFEQNLAPTHGWGYGYQKRVRLTPDGAGLVIERTLHNTGTRPLVTEHYSHQMFAFQQCLVDQDYRLRFPFVPAGVATNGRAGIDGQELWISALPPGRSFWSEVRGFDSERPMTFEILHRRLKQGMTVTTDRPLVRFHVYAESAALCPEPFVTIHLNPGQDYSWRTTYQFH